MAAAQDNIGAILLAAGMSRRMGSPKALLDIGGKPLIARLLEQVVKVPAIRRIIVVTGHEPHNVQRAIDPSIGVVLVHNSEYQTGEMLSSIKTGASAINEVDAFFIMLLDQPLVIASTLEMIIRTRQAKRPTIIIPTHGGKHGHPILLDGTYAAQIMSLPATGSLRDIVVQARAESQVQTVEVDDSEILSDIDTPEDYQALVMRWDQAAKGRTRLS